MSAHEEKPVQVETAQSRAEKKARKTILNNGLKPVQGINRVTFTRAGGIVFAIATPEVYKSVNSDTFIVFGDMQMEDMRARAQEAAAQQLAAEAEAKDDEAEGSAAPAAVEEDDTEEVDAGDIEEKDIELVVSQANVSRNKAIKALKNNDKDIVNAIMVRKAGGGGMGNTE
jgi:nascent polypeptide-associated complex subunit alpha